MSLGVCVADALRYIVLSDSIIDREKIFMIERDPHNPGVVKVYFDNSTSEEWDGDNARAIWDAFNPSKDWRNN